jgi:hypothetical protein
VKNNYGIPHGPMVQLSFKINPDYNSHHQCKIPE